MPFLKTALPTVTNQPAWTQVDINGLAGVSGTPTEVTLQLAGSCKEVQFRTASGQAEYSFKSFGKASGMEYSHQVRIPLLTNRYFEFRTVGGGSLTAHLVHHNG